MDDLYREHILDHFKHPRNKGTIENPDITFEDSNPLCGDVIRMDIKLKDGFIEDVKFSGKGCAISQASASMLTEAIKGEKVDNVKAISKEDIFDMLGIPLSPSRVKCALLSLKVLKAGLYGIKGWPGEEE